MSDKLRADEEPLPLVTILNINGLDDALLALQCVDDTSQVRRYRVWCARQVQHLMTDPRSLTALDVAERYADGKATDNDLAAAWVAANDAASVAVMAAERAAARAAASAASSGAAWVAANDAALAAASDAAYGATRAAQEVQFRIMFGGAT